MRSRISRFKYGIRMSVPYDPYNPEHAKRSSQAVFMADGIKHLPNAFSTILEKVRATSPAYSRLALTGRQGVRVSETQEFRNAYYYFSSSRQNLNRVNDTIRAYKGNSNNPRWIDSEPGHYLYCWSRFHYLIPALHRIVLQSLHGLCGHLQGPKTESRESSRQPLRSTLRGGPLVWPYRAESTGGVEGRRR